MSRGVFVTDEQVRLTGSPNVARFLAQCLYWSNNELVKSRQGWFYKSRVEWKEETWLSRYQQEKARESLRDIGLLKESRERTNLGIRLWFWLDLALYNRMINRLAEQEIMISTEDCSVELYDRSLTDESRINKDDDLEESIETTESSSIKDNETIVLNTALKDAFKPEISTNVSDNNKTDHTEGSDLSCDESSGICLDIEAYQSCHPFIYQFMKTRVLSGHNQTYVLQDDFIVDGFCESVLEALRQFIDQFGHQIIDWYQANTPIRIQPLSQDDIQLARLIAGKGST